MRFASILLLALAPVLPGCVAAAVGVTAGFLVGQEVLPNDIHTAQVMLDVEEVWAAAQETMRNMSAEPIEVQDFPRTIRGKVDGADVEVEVLAYDLDRTIIQVEAKRYMVSRGETAGRVLNQILDRLDS